MDGKELKEKTILAVYRAFDKNRVIVKDMQAYLETQRQLAKDQLPESGASEEILVQQPLVRALMGAEKETRNVLDVLYVLYQNSGSMKLVNANLNDLMAYILEYCPSMVNGHEHRGAAMAAAVRKAIVEASTVLKASDVSPNFSNCCESFLDGLKL